MKKSKQPWSTKAVMQQIYNDKLWGGKGFDFYSGDGSHQTEIVQPYLDAAISFLTAHNNTLTVCDLGCGDFNIGKHLIRHTKKYIAVDIVAELIKRNKIQFKAENLEFKCLDIVEDKLPKADCIILRQVLQHLSNSEVINIVKKLNNYRYLMLTEHIPVDDFDPNKDKIASQGIRLKQNSGVDLAEVPFNLKFKEEKVLLETILENNKGRIKTVLYTL